MLKIYIFHAMWLFFTRMCDFALIKNKKINTIDGFPKFYIWFFKIIDKSRQNSNPPSWKKYKLPFQ